MSSDSLFERAGGEPVVRAVVDRFVDRQFEDKIIGFFFTGKDPDRVKRHEYEHAAAALGADVVYRGRPIPALHRPLRINAGQFRRRLVLLEREIDRAAVPADVKEAWLAGQRRMEKLITDGTDCAPPGDPAPTGQVKPVSGRPVDVGRGPRVVLFFGSLAGGLARVGMTAVQAAFLRFDRAGIGVVAFTRCDLALARDFVPRHHLLFPVVVDADGAHFDAWGVGRDRGFRKSLLGLRPGSLHTFGQALKLGPPSVDTQLSAQFVVGADGRIRLAHYASTLFEQPDIEVLSGRLPGMIALWLAVGCARLPHAHSINLPSQLSLLAEGDDGAPISMLLELPRNTHDKIDVRFAEGAVLFDGRRVWEIVPDASGGVGVVELVDGVRARLPLKDTPRLVALERGAAWFKTPDLVRCTLRDARCLSVKSPPALPLTSRGPGVGFAVTLSEGAIHVTLPQAPDGFTVLSGVKEIIGVHWVTGRSASAAPVLNRTFRGRAIVYAPPRSVDVDGDLAEWRGASPMVVQSPWQLQSGAPGWDGVRDGGFNIASGWSEGQVCFAGRVYDDHLEPGDLLTLQVGDAHLDLPLDGDAPAGAAYGPAWFGRIFEACLPGDTHAASLPFLASFVDSDGADPPARLASAAESNGRPLGSLRFTDAEPASTPRPK